MIGSMEASQFFSFMALFVVRWVVFSPHDYFLKPIKALRSESQLGPSPSVLRHGSPLEPSF